MSEDLEYRELGLGDVKQQLVDDFNRLLPQLTSNAVPLTTEWLNMLFKSGTRIFAALDGETVVGTVLLCSTVILVGRKDWIEDVVVSTEYRGRGIAGRLMSMAEDASRRSGAKSVNLTSRPDPDRDDARSMYDRRGYVPRDTVVYRLAHQTHTA